LRILDRPLPDQGRGRLPFAGSDALDVTTARAALAGLAVLLPVAAFAHSPSEEAKQRMLEGDFLDVALLGADHMLTGYDHLLFLLGVLFFLSRPLQIVSFITAFTLGHTLVLMTATPLGVGADPYLIDAFIALTVVYKAFENLGGFRRVLGVDAPPLLPMVFVFGLIHGFGLSTRLQDMALPADPQFFGKIIAFNIGVELGQVAALAVMGAALFLWRETRAWRTFARAANVLLIVAGALLFTLQVRGWLTDAAGSPPPAPAAALAPADGS
jgi:hypothetical protein